MLRSFVLETVSAPGAAATVTLAGAPDGRRTWLSAFASGADAYYFMDDGTQQEWGWGNPTSGPPAAFTRTTVIGNSAGGTGRLTFTGTTRLFCEIPAERLAYVMKNGGLSVDAADIGVPHWAGTAGGTVNALTLSLTPQPTTLRAGMEIRFLASGTNTGAVTASVTGTSVGALEVVKENLAPLLPGDLAAGYLGTLVFDGTRWRLGTAPASSSRLVGELVQWTSDTLPAGFVWPDGRNLSRTGFPALHARYQADGYRFGAGDGSTTFGVPDVRGRAIVGKDSLGGTAANRLTAGNAGFNAGVLGAAGGDERLQSHLHGVNDPAHNHGTDTQGAHAHNANDIVIVGSFGLQGGSNVAAGFGSRVTDVQGAHGHNISAAFTGISIQAAGSGGSQNVQPSIALNHILYAGA